MESRIQERLDSRNFKVDIDFMIPARGGSRALSSPYSLTLIGNKVISYLPYVGVARNVPYGGGSGMNFESTTDDFTEQAARKDRRVFLFTTRTDEDRMTFKITVFSNGTCSVTVHSENRDPIDYQGQLDPDTDPSKPEL